MPDSSIPRAELHTPKELLAIAEELFNSGDEKVLRAVILEAITALEAYVSNRVFPTLESKLDPLLVKWLEERTRTDFDSRLDTFVPVAIGRQIDKRNHLWSDYKDAKAIRNRVTHSGRRVTRDEAMFVLRTVFAWLAFMGSTIEVELSLLALKKFIESSKMRVPTNTTLRETDVIKLVKQYFESSRSSVAKVEVPIRENMRADLVLFFENYSILVETKFVVDQIFEEAMRHAIQQTLRMMEGTRLDRGVIILFSNDSVPETFSKPYLVGNGRISVIGIQFPR